MASEMHAKEKQEQLRSLYIVSTRITLAIFLPIALILVILAKPFSLCGLGPPMPSTLILF